MTQQEVFNLQNFRNAFEHVLKLKSRQFKISDSLLEHYFEWIDYLVKMRFPNQESPKPKFETSLTDFGAASDAISKSKTY